MLRTSDSGHQIERQTPGRRYGLIHSAAALLLATTAGFLAMPARATTPAAETIVVEGNRRIDADTVRSYFHTAPDGRLDTAALDAALKALIETGLFDNITIDRNAGRLVVHVSEAKILGPSCVRLRATLLRRSATPDVLVSSTRLAAAGAASDISRFAE